MTRFPAVDGTQLAHRSTGAGDPLVCVPGGPMQASSYLGDLGGLSAHRTLELLDLRGTGESDAPADPAAYRCDRLADDVEALRTHLGRGRIDLLAHSGGAAVAVLYAARHPDRVGRLALICPSPRVVGLEIADADRQRVARLRRGEEWFPEAYAALERVGSGDARPDDWAAITPFLHGRWDADARERAAREASLQNAEAAAAYYPDDLDHAAVRSALADLPAPVLVLAGELDVALPPTCAAAYADLFGRGERVVQPGAGHAPWHDDPARFVEVVRRFLG